MIVFPDHSVETEYTDPNGVDWIFDGTGWVKKCDCPDGSDGGDVGGDIVTGHPSAGWVLESTWEKPGIRTRSDFPVVIGDDIYLVEMPYNSGNATTASVIQIGTSDLSVNTIHDSVAFPGSSTSNGKWYFNFRDDKAVTSNAVDKFLKKQSDGSVAVEDIDTGWANASAALGVSGLSPQQKIVGHDGKLVVVFLTSSRYMHWVEYNDDGTVSACSDSTNRGILSGSTNVQGYILKTPYGYATFAGGWNSSGPTLRYVVATWQKDGTYIANRSVQQTVYSENVTVNAINPRALVPTSDGLSAAIEYAVDRSNENSSILWGVNVSADGKIPVQFYGDFSPVEGMGKLGASMTLHSPIDSALTNGGFAAFGDARLNGVSLDGRTKYIKANLSRDRRYYDQVSGPFPITYLCDISSLVNKDGQAVGRSVGMNIKMPTNLPCASIPENSSYQGYAYECPVIHYKDDVWIQFLEDRLFIYREAKPKTVVLAAQPRETMHIEDLASQAEMEVEDYLKTGQGQADQKMISDYQARQALIFEANSQATEDSNDVDLP